MADSTREAALKALKTALDGVSGSPTVLRNETEEQAIPADGLIVLRDGDVGEPVDTVLSPTSYYYEHRAEVEVFYQAANQVTRDTGLDGLLQAIAAAVNADRTLGGTVDYVRSLQPELDDEPFEGNDDIKAATVPILLSYSTTDPLT